MNKKIAQKIKEYYKQLAECKTVQEKEKCTLMILAFVDGWVTVTMENK